MTAATDSMATDGGSDGATATGAGTGTRMTAATASAAMDSLATDGGSDGATATGAGIGTMATAVPKRAVTAFAAKALRTDVATAVPKGAATAFARPGTVGALRARVAAADADRAEVALPENRFIHNFRARPLAKIGLCALGN